MWIIGCVMLLGIGYVLVCLYKYPERLMNKKTGKPYTKQDFKYPLIAAGFMAILLLILPPDESVMTADSQQEILRKVAAEMNAEPDAQAFITVQDNGAVVIDPVLPKPELEAAAYQILSDEKMGTIKRSVEVVLDEPVTKAQLSDLAEKIRAMDAQKYERTFILYRVKGVELPSGMAWATSHFNPDLEVKMLADDQGIDVRK